MIADNAGPATSAAAGDGGHVAEDDPVEISLAELASRAQSTQLPLPNPSSSGAGI